MQQQIVTVTDAISSYQFKGVDIPHTYGPWYEITCLWAFNKARLKQACPATETI